MSDLTDPYLEPGDESELVAAAVSWLGTVFPEWQPREGRTESVLIESLALMLSEVAYRQEQIPDQVLAKLLGLYGLTQGGAVAARVQVVFTLDPTITGETTIPAGTQVSFPGQDGTPVAFATVQTMASVGTLSIQANAVDPGAAGNGIGAGTAGQLVSPIAAVSTVTTGSVSEGGSDGETDDAFLARGRVVLGRAVSTLVLPAHFESAALEVAGLGRAKCLDLTDPTADPQSPVLGHVTVGVLGANGGLTDQGTKDSVLQALVSRSQAGLTVHVVDPTITEVDVTVHVTATEGFTAATVQANVASAVAAFLSPVTWDWSPVVHPNDLISIAAQATGVRRVVSVTPTGDTSLPGTLPLADAGTITVVVDG